MRPDQRVVTRLPLTELWDAHGVLPLARGRVVGRKQVADLLRRAWVTFVLANCSDPLTWVAPEDGHRFWKDDVKPTWSNRM